MPEVVQTDSHNSSEYHPNEVTTVPIDQTYNADNASTSNNANTADADVKADSNAVGATYGSNVYTPDLSAGGVSLVLSPSVTKMGTAQGGMTSSAAKEFPWAALLAAAVLAAGCWYVYKRRRTYYG